MTKKTKALISGSNGQLGNCLKATEPEEMVTRFCDRTEFDLTDQMSMAAALDEFIPDYVVNCAAYTNVDGAETDEAGAMAVNHKGVAALATLCSARNIKLIHVSTDFVFDGTNTVPYLPTDKTSPLGVYGKSKSLGEEAIAQAYPEGSMIFRTSWLYSEFGGNFVKTMIRLFDTKDEFSVVSNQQGSPTYALGLARFIWSVVSRDDFRPGVYHWSDAGETSWFEFAAEIGFQGEQKGLLTNERAQVNPISSEDYGSVTPRPNYSVLDCTSTVALVPGLERVLWSANLSLMLDRLKGDVV